MVPESEEVQFVLNFEYIIEPDHFLSPRLHVTLLEF